MYMCEYELLTCIINIVVVKIKESCPSSIVLLLVRKQKKVMDDLVGIPLCRHVLVLHPGLMVHQWSHYVGL